MDPAQVKALPDVQAIGRLSESRSGRGDLALLDCLGRFGSIREIAAAQHMHHSSVAYRLAKIGEILGYDPRTPEGQYRARTALLLWHLHAHLPARAPRTVLKKIFPNDPWFFSHLWPRFSPARCRQPVKTVTTAIGTAPASIGARIPAAAARIPPANLPSCVAPLGRITTIR